MAIMCDRCGSKITPFFEVLVDSKVCCIDCVNTEQYLLGVIKEGLEAGFSRWLECGVVYVNMVDDDGKGEGVIVLSIAGKQYNIRIKRVV